MSGPLRERLEALIAERREKRAAQRRQADRHDAEHDTAGNAHTCLARARIYAECLVDVEAALRAAPAGKDVRIAVDITVMNALIRDDETDAAARRANAPRCAYCGRALAETTDYCALCAVDITHEQEGSR